MIQIMIVNLEELNIHYDGESFSKYLNDISMAVNKRLNTLRNLSIQGISMNLWNGEIKSVIVMYYPTKYHRYNPNANEPYPQIYLSTLENITDVENHVNSMLMALQNSDRYVNYVKVFGENFTMPGYCSIIHSPLSEGSYTDR